jgi:hypothetical protein
LSVDDALVAAEALREISADHEEAALAVLNGGEPDALTTEDLKSCATGSARALGL